MTEKKCRQPQGTYLEDGEAGSLASLIIQDATAGDREQDLQRTEMPPQLLGSMTF